MRITNKNIVILVFLIALFLFIVGSIWLWVLTDIPIDPELKMDYYQFALDVYKAIGIGFLIALLGMLIPNILPEAKYEFEMIKEGRAIYSKAKTGIDYLPYRLQELNFSESMKHIETIHQLKHLADTYLKVYGGQVGNWPYDPYEHIIAYRNLIVTCSQSKWDKLTIDERSKLLNKVNP